MAHSFNFEHSVTVGDLSKLLGQSEKKIKMDLFKLQEENAKTGPALIRLYLTKKGFKYPHQIISFQMLKGGVSKTTSAVLFGIRAAMYGARVLFLDLDQQANLTFALGVDAENLPVWLDVVEKKITAKEAIIPLHSGIHLIPSNLNNSVLDRVLMNSNRNWSLSIKTPLQDLFLAYDLVIIDTAPHLSMVNTAVSCASHKIILPVNPDRFSFVGLKKHLEDLNEIREEFHLTFDTQILFTKYDARETSSREMLTYCLDEYRDLMLQNYIRTTTEIKNKLGTSRKIFTSAPSKAKDDYDLLTQELLGFRS